MVWAGICAHTIAGPYFFENEKVNGTTYSDMLQNLKIELAESPVFAGHQMTLQQDGEPAHFSVQVRTFLNENFPGWIGRRGIVDWPPWSPDLTPCDFALWGILKDRVFARRPRSIEILKAVITEELYVISDDKALLEHICQTVRKRCLACIDEDGGHIENTTYIN